MISHLMLVDVICLGFETQIFILGFLFPFYIAPERHKQTSVRSAWHWQTEKMRQSSDYRFRCFNTAQSLGL